jgi:hypothetical protein
MIDVEKLRHQIEEKIPEIDDSVDGDDSRYMDDYITEAMEVVKKVSFKDKIEYAKQNLKHLEEALQEMPGPGFSVGELLDEMIFMQIS